MLDDHAWIDLIERVRIQMDMLCKPFLLTLTRNLVPDVVCFCARCWNRGIFVDADWAILTA